METSALTFATCPQCMSRVTVVFGFLTAQSPSEHTTDLHEAHAQDSAHEYLGCRVSLKAGQKYPENLDENVSQHLLFLRGDLHLLRSFGTSLQQLRVACMCERPPLV